MSFIRNILDVRKGELGKTAGMFLWFFIVIAAYWFLKPTREALTVGILGADSIPTLKFIVALVSAVVVVAYSLVLPYLSRERLAYIVIGSFIWLMIFFWYFFTYHSEVKLLYYSFYVFLDLFNTVNVALFWTFLADIMKTGSAKRLYGLIGGGGVIGGFFGATTCWSVIKFVEPAQMLVYVAIAYSSVLAIIYLVSRHVDREPGAVTGVIAQKGKSRLHDALEGARTVFSSRYFLGICAILAFYELVSTVNYVVFNKGVELFIMPEVGKEGLGDFYSKFYLILNIVSVSIQLLLTSFIIRRLGMVAALLALPVVLGGLSVAFLAVPVFVLVGGIYLVDNSLNYSINQTSREMLFIPVPRKDKYATLAFTDMFVLRMAKATGAALSLLLPYLLVIDSLSSLRFYMLMTLPAMALWGLIAFYLGRHFKLLSGPSKGDLSSDDA